MNNFKAYRVGQEAPHQALRRGDVIRADGVGYPFHFAYVSDDRRIATQEPGQNPIIRSPAQFGIIVKETAMTKLRIAPPGAKAPVTPAPPQLPTMIDVTPTWRAILPMLLAAHGSNSFPAIKEAETELRRMADLADLYVTLAKYDGDTIRDMLNAAAAAGQKDKTE